ncbi:unnamed protein product [Vitrella brassicaformis CCMP3155]|uniref:Uncharacterized protein n=1 Tax=Vitrella brassicaformis (strain CCMP3155) TaxID=1169540 RepID=A0A0G4GGL5_VITBC|nr:unnamed protein product [Vitrella brassicaformis CCMP3155]|eukprot:CEM28768.1 unnamed protein product [Vitrella brassicaformis CCMP3155]
MQHHEQQQQQHPVSYLCVGRRSRYLLGVKDVVRLRATCTWLRELFGAAQLRDRLRHSLDSQAGLRRANVNGQQVQLLRFDDDQFDAHDLLAAVCVVEEGDWGGEMGDVIELAGQCGNCELPVPLSGADINTHANITLKMWRAIIDEPNFELELDPPLPAGHLFQQHRQPHDPPVRNRIFYSTVRARWLWSGGLGCTDKSVSSFAKYKILDQFRKTHSHQDINCMSAVLNRDVGGGRLNRLLTQSPHTPVAGCTTTLGSDAYGGSRWLVLTDGSHPFVAWINIWDRAGNTVIAYVYTTEAAVCESGAFKNRFPVTTQLARVALGAVAPFVFDGQLPQQQQQQDDDSDDDSDGGDEIVDGVDDGSGGESGAAEAEGGG